MEENKISELRVVWCSFMDDTNNEVRGYFRLVEQAPNYVKLLSGKNLLTIPYQRLLKLKESLE
jgi:hypothetical protein